MLCSNQQLIPSHRAVADRLQVVGNYRAAGSPRELKHITDTHNNFTAHIKLRPSGRHHTNFRLSGPQELLNAGRENGVPTQVKRGLTRNLDEVTHPVFHQ